MKKNQIIKVKGQPANNLYRYGGEDIRDNLPTLYYIMELENKFKVWGYANSLSCFLKPTLKDIIDYVDSVNEKKSGTIVARSIALILPKQHLQAIKDSIRPRVYAIYNDSVALEQWENYVAVVLHEKSTDVVPVVSIVNDKDLAEEVLTIDFEDIDLGPEPEKYNTKPQKENTIRFLSAEDGTLLFAGKEFELSKFDTFVSTFDANPCEIYFWSSMSIINEVRFSLLSVCGIVKKCGITYEVSKIQNIDQEPAYDFVTKESGFNVKIIFKNSRVLSDPGRSHSKLKLDLRSNYEDDSVIQKAIRISKLDAETIKSEGENDIMKINNKALKQIIIDEDRKTVTAIATDDPSVYDHYLGLEPIKYVTVAKAAEEDDFDPYVGVAMALAYQLFGSKENFRKFVRENGLVKSLKKEREARAAAKKEAKEKAEEAHKKAVARKAKRAAKKAEKEEAVATELLKQLSKLLNKTDKRAKAEKGE